MVKDCARREQSTVKTERSETARSRALKEDDSCRLDIREAVNDAAPEERKVPVKRRREGLKPGLY